MPGRVPREVVVHDRIEKLLQVDAFGEAIGRHQNPLGAFFLVFQRHLRNAIAALVRGQLSGYGLDYELWESLSQPSLYVIGGCQIPTKNDRVGTALDQRLERTDEGIKLGIFRFKEAARLINESTERGIIRESHTRLDVHGIFVVAVFVIDLRFETVCFVGSTISQSTQRGSRR